jgi:hypothetical protein
MHARNAARAEDARAAQAASTAGTSAVPPCAWPPPGHRGARVPPRPPASGAVRHYPQQAGLASGINSTFRQVGIATGIAVLGTLFSNDVKDEVLTRTAAVPALSARRSEIAGAVQSGQIGNVIARLPAPARQVAGGGLGGADLGGRGRRRAGTSAGLAAGRRG